MASQRQRSGDQSLNIQGRDVVIAQGLSVQEVRDIALDLFRANFYELAGAAQQVAKERAEEITNEFLERLQQENPRGLGRAIDPDIQYAVFTAQREYARSGDKQLGKLLVDLLVDRSKQAERNILQIVLNESLGIVPKLTNDQLATLSIVFVLVYKKQDDLRDLDDLKSYIDQYLGPFIPLLTTNSACYQHLEYAGCALIRPTHVRIEEILHDAHPALFDKGIPRNVGRFLGRSMIGRFPAFFRPCMHDPERVQVNAKDPQELEQLQTAKGLNKNQKAELSYLYSAAKMSAEEVRDYLIGSHPMMKILLNVWDHSYIRNLALTSVGIAIAHANLRSIIRDSDELSLWIG